MSSPGAKYASLAFQAEQRGHTRVALRFRLQAAEHYGDDNAHTEAEAEYRAASVLCERMADFHSSQRAPEGANRGRTSVD